MNKLAIVYWSGTGNTEAMANCIAEGAKEAGAEVTLMGPADFSAARFSEFGAVAFGCPAMGSEVLEESEFQPMWDDVKGKLSGKSIVLFGSYGWGTGEWMDYWKDDAVASGATLAADPLILNGSPDDAGLTQCKELGKVLA